MKTIKPAGSNCYDIYGNKIDSKYLQIIDDENAVLLKPNIETYLIRNKNSSYPYHWKAVVYEELVDNVVQVEHLNGCWFKLENVDFYQLIHQSFLVFQNELEI